MVVDGCRRKRVVAQFQCQPVALKHLPLVVEMGKTFSTDQGAIEAVKIGRARRRGERLQKRKVHYVVDYGRSRVRIAEQQSHGVGSNQVVTNVAQQLWAEFAFKVGTGCAGCRDDRLERMLLMSRRAGLQ